MTHFSNSRLEISVGKSQQSHHRSFISWIFFCILKFLNLKQFLIAPWNESLNYNQTQRSTLHGTVGDPKGQGLIQISISHVWM